MSLSSVSWPPNTDLQRERINYNKKVLWDRTPDKAYYAELFHFFRQKNQEIKFLI